MCVGDSHVGPADVGTADAPWSLLVGLAEQAAAGTRLPGRSAGYLFVCPRRYVAHRRAAEAVPAGYRRGTRPRRRPNSPASAGGGGGLKGEGLAGTGRLEETPLRKQGGDTRFVMTVVRWPMRVDNDDDVQTESRTDDGGVARTGERAKTRGWWKKVGRSGCGRRIRAGAGVAGPLSPRRIELSSQYFGTPCSPRHDAVRLRCRFINKRWHGRSPSSFLLFTERLKQWSGCVGCSALRVFRGARDPTGDMVRGSPSRCHRPECRALLLSLQALSTLRCWGRRLVSRTRRAQRRPVHSKRRSRPHDQLMSSTAARLAALPPTDDVLRSFRRRDRNRPTPTQDTTEHHQHHDPIPVDPRSWVASPGVLRPAESFSAQSTRPLCLERRTHGDQIDPSVRTAGVPLHHCRRER